MRYLETLQVYGKNFHSIGSIPIVFDIEKGSTLLVGENGAGKTSLLAMLLYNRYGSAVGDKSIDSIVNTVAGGNCLTMEKYRIVDESDDKLNNKLILCVRGRKKNIFEVFILTEDINLRELPHFTKNEEATPILKEFGTQISQPTKDAQNRYEKEFLLADESIFKAMVSIHGDDDDFASFTKTNKRKYITKIFNIQWFDILVELKKAEKKVLDKEYKELKEKYDSNLVKLEVESSNKELIETSNKELEETHLLRIQNIDAQIEELEKQKKENLFGVSEIELNQSYHQQLGSLNLAELALSEITMLKSNIASEQALYDTKLESYIKDSERLSEELKTTKKEILNSSFDVNSSIDAKEKEKTSKEIELKTIDDLKEYISTTKEKLLKDKTVIESENKTVNESKEKIYADLVELNTSEANLSDSLKDIDSEELKTKLNNILEKKTSITKTVSIITSKIEEHQSKIEYYQNNGSCDECGQHIDTSFAKNKIESATEEINSINSNIEKGKANLVKLSEAIDTIQEKLNSFDQDSSKLSSVKNDIHKLSESMSNLIIKEDSIKESAKSFNALKDEFSSKIDVDEPLDTKRDVIVSDIHKLSTEIENYTKEKETYEKLTNRLTSVEYELALLEEPKENKELIKELSEKKDSVVLEKDIVDFKKTIANLETTIKTIESINLEINDKESSKKTIEEVYKSNIKSTVTCEENIEDLNSKINVVSDQIDIVCKNIQIKENIIKLFKNDDLKDALFNKYIEMMNYYALDIINQLNLKFRVQFKPNFEIEIEGYNQAPEFGGMSGGQQKQINFIILATFHKLLSLIGNFKTNIIFLDEYLDRLDIKNVPKVTKICVDYFKDMSLYMIVHNENIYSYFDRIMYVKNEVFTSVTEVDPKDEEAMQRIKDDFVIEERE